MATQLLFRIYWVTLLFIFSNGKSILTPWYGNNKEHDHYHQVLDEGRVNYIAVAHDQKNVIQIKAWNSDSRTVNIDQFGNGIDSTPCINISISSEDFITGYSIWNDSRDNLIGIEFLTRNGLIHTCYNPISTNDTKITMNYVYDTDDFYYLSGWNLYSDLSINNLQLQFTKFESTISVNENILDQVPNNEELGSADGIPIYYVLGVIIVIICVLPILGTLIWSKLQKSRKFETEKNMQSVITKGRMSDANHIEIQYSKDDDGVSEKHVTGDIRNV